MYIYRTCLFKAFLKRLLRTDPIFVISDEFQRGSLRKTAENPILKKRAQSRSRTSDMYMRGYFRSLSYLISATTLMFSILITSLTSSILPVRDT